MGSRSQSTQSIPSWALPAAKSIFSTGFDLSAPGQTPAYLPEGLNLAPFNPALEQQLAGFNPTQQAGMDYLTGSAGASADLAGAGAQQLQDTLQGQYLSPESNPYLQSTYNAAADAMTNQYQQAIAPSLMAQAQQGGVMGGSGMQEQQAYNQFNLGQNLSDLASKIYGGNYAAERGNQLAGLGMVGAGQQAISAPGQQLLGVGALGQGQTQAGMDVATQNAQLRQEYPYKQLSYLGNLLGTATTGGGSVTAGTSK